MRPELYGFGAAYALIVIILTFYNFGRAPHPQSRGNRFTVLLAVTLFSAGTVLMLLGMDNLLESSLGPGVAEMLGHVSMATGTTLFLYFSWETKQALDKRRTDRLDRGMAALPSSAAVAAVTVLVISVVAVSMYTLLGAEVAFNAMHLLLPPLLLAALWTWIRVESLAGASPTAYVNLKATITVILIASLAHSFLMLGLKPVWMEAILISGLLIGASFWISATYDVARGKI